MPSMKNFIPAEVDECEPDVVVEYDHFAEERMTRDYPGSPEHCEVTDVLFDGESILAEIPEDLLEQFAEDALEHATAGPRERGD